MAVGAAGVPNWLADGLHEGAAPELDEEEGAVLCWVAEGVTAATMLWRRPGRGDAVEVALLRGVRIDTIRRGGGRWGRGVRRFGTFPERHLD